MSEKLVEFLVQEPGSAAFRNLAAMRLDVRLNFVVKLTELLLIANWRTHSVLTSSHLLCGARGCDRRNGTTGSNLSSCRTRLRGCTTSSSPWSRPIVSYSRHGLLLLLSLQAHASRSAKRRKGELIHRRHQAGVGCHGRLGEPTANRVLRLEELAGQQTRIDGGVDMLLRMHVDLLKSVRQGCIQKAASKAFGRNAWLLSSSLNCC